MSKVGRRVLVVDDDDAVALMIKETLGRVGMTVVHAPTIETAEGLFAENEFDAVLLDGNVNGGISNTVRFLGKMRKSGYLGMVVGISSCDHSNGILRQHGAEHCVRKGLVVKKLWGLFNPIQA
ncbi:MAG: response regulator [Patescibacteria group bacterium]